MTTDKKYTEISSKTILSNKEYTITELIPNLKNEEQVQIANEIKNSLFQIFKKYL